LILSRIRLKIRTTAIRYYISHCLISFLLCANIYTQRNYPLFSFNSIVIATCCSCYWFVCCYWFVSIVTRNTNETAKVFIEDVTAFWWKFYYLFRWQIGEVAKLKPVEVELKRLEDLSEAIVQDFARMRKNEEEMRDTNGKKKKNYFLL